MKTLIEAKQWRVVSFGDGDHEVHGPHGTNISFRMAELACARAALTGDPDAVTAALLCQQDVRFQKTLRAVMEGKEPDEENDDE